jgi:hypothetical protein
MDYSQQIVCFIISKGNYTLDNQPSLQKFQKQIWNSYMNSNPLIKSYFIEFNNTIEEDFKETTTLEGFPVIFFKGEESIIPGIFNKRQKAFQFAIEKFKNLKYVIQTNLSSFFIWDKMLNFIPNNPPPNFLIGLKWSGFPSGCGTIYSKSVSNIIASSNIDPSLEHDDCTIGKILLKNNIHNYDGYYHMSHDLTTVPFHCYHLRARIDISLNETQRIEFEIPFMMKCLDTYYPNIKFNFD